MRDNIPVADLQAALKSAGAWINRKSTLKPGFILAVFVAVVLWRSAVAGGRLTVCHWGCNFNSIQAAIDAASPGDTIYIQPGFYRESLVITKSLVLRGNGPDRVVIQGARPGWPVVSVWTTEPGDLITIALERDTPIEVTLEGLQIQGADWYSSEVECARFASTICPDGIAVRGRATVTLRDLWVHHNRDNGISLGLRARATVQDCAIWANGDDGVHAWLKVEVAILGSTISGNSAHGINLQSRFYLLPFLYLEGGVRATIVGNRITGNGGYGIEAQTGEELVSCYGNVIQGNGEGPYSPAAWGRCW